ARSASIVTASPSSRGLPRRSPSSSTSVSTASVAAPLRATCSALAFAGEANALSSIRAGETSNGTSSSRKSSMRRGEADARRSTTTTYTRANDGDERRLRAHAHQSERGKSRDETAQRRRSALADPHADKAAGDDRYPAARRARLRVRRGRGRGPQRPAVPQLGHGRLRGARERRRLGGRPPPCRRLG